VRKGGKGNAEEKLQQVIAAQLAIRGGAKGSSDNTQGNKKKKSLYEMLAKGLGGKKKTGKGPRRRPQANWGSNETETKKEVF